MSLEQKVMTDLKTAMLAKDEKGLRSLRAIKSRYTTGKNIRRRQRRIKRR